MPPRWIVFAIVACWLAATAWFIQRDMWPYWFPPPDNPPDYDIDMTDEFGSNHTNWHVFVNNEDLPSGTGTSEVRVLKDSSFEFNTELKFRKPLFNVCVSISSTNHITNKGHLLDLAIKVKYKLPPSDYVFEDSLKARIDKGRLLSKVTILGASMDLEPMDVPENGIVFNPAHLGTRIRQLRNGQTWRVPLVDLGAMVVHSKDIIGSELWASVSEETISWDKRDVECFKIEFTQLPRKKVGTIWVRQRDGQVLKQQAKVMDVVELLLVRVHYTGF